MIKAIEWIGDQNGYLKLLDQTKLPLKTEYIICKNVDIVVKAIKTLQVRGAPAIGVAAAYGFYIGMRQTSPKSFNKQLDIIKDKLISARPTAVNLAWAVKRVSSRVSRQKSGLRFATHELTSSPTKVGTSLRYARVDDIKKELFKEARRIHKEDIETCRNLGEHGAKLIKNGMRILTYCNAGMLATAGIGTALAIFYQAKRNGKKFKVYSSETRPLLQGARLTTWELQQGKIDVTLICDNMIGKLMSDGEIDMVALGADRIASNGDTANKIGTYQVAVLAHHHKIPFYVVAPISTFDYSIKSGKQIPIEFRIPEEVTSFRECRTAPKGMKAYNPAFDVTPAKFITGIVTEKGIIKPNAK